jgi:hypothetical protein
MNSFRSSQRSRMVSTARSRCANASVIVCTEGKYFSTENVEARSSHSAELINDLAWTTKPQDANTQARQALQTAHAHTPEHAMIDIQA